MVKGWDIHYAALLEYIKQHDHGNVPQNRCFECVLPRMNEDGSDYIYAGKLGKWVKTQRRIKKGTRGKQRLRPEREALLQALVDQSESYLILFCG